MGIYDMCKNPQPIDTDVSYGWKDIVKWMTDGFNNTTSRKETNGRSSKYAKGSRKRKH